MRVGTKGRSGKTRSSPLHESKHRSESPSMHFISTTNTRHNDYRNSSLSRRDLHNTHNTAERTSSYSPQYSPKLDTTDYHTSSSRYYKRESEVSDRSEVLLHLLHVVWAPLVNALYTHSIQGLHIKIRTFG